MEQIHQVGIKTYVFLSPIFPKILNKFRFASGIASIFNIDPNLIEPLLNHPGKAPRLKNLSLSSNESLRKLGVKFNSPKHAFDDLKLQIEDEL
ncbi:hypothetical protein [Candidatus Lokiarchaeum ossiferum]|uniref:hypothetical protein n=1 Tax=Candidatus Lokiarchaeum ossiferum TaxID=2951803 RepID=UPI00352EB1D7